VTYVQNILLQIFERVLGARSGDRAVISLPWHECDADTCGTGDLFIVSDAFRDPFRICFGCDRPKADSCRRGILMFLRSVVYALTTAFTVLSLRRQYLAFRRARTGTDSRSCMIHSRRQVTKNSTRAVKAGGIYQQDGTALSAESGDSLVRM
jgi:hypothetical protein